MYFILKSSLFLLLSVVLSQCQDDQCPAPTAVYPCECYSRGLGITVLCNGDENRISIEALRKSLKNLYGKKIENLHLQNLKMEQASSELLNNLVIQEAYLYETNIMEMPAFKGSENTLQKITLLKAISQRSMQNFTLKVSHLNKLKSFRFAFNYYTLSKDMLKYNVAVGNNWFKNGPSSLEVVDLSYNVPKSLGDSVLTDLVNLKEINLQNNQIEEVHRSMFPVPARKLLEINLQYNNLKSLPEDIFNNMPVLDRVDLSFNSINVLNERTWRPVWDQLDSLKLGSGLICDSAISWMFKLSRPYHLEGLCSPISSLKEYGGRFLAEIIDQQQGLSSETK